MGNWCHAHSEPAFPHAGGRRGGSQRGQWRIENDQLEDYISRQYARAEHDAHELTSSDGDITSDH
jgi:hypothetical protein